MIRHIYVATLFVSMVLASILKANSSKYAVIDLGTASDDNTFLSGLSNTGNVLWINDYTDAFRWQPGDTIPEHLNLDPGETLYYCGGIDDQGNVAGTYLAPAIGGSDLTAEYPTYWPHDSQSKSDLSFHQFGIPSQGGYAYVAWVDYNGTVYGYGNIDETLLDPSNPNEGYVVVDDGLKWSFPGLSLAETGGITASRDAYTDDQNRDIPGPVGTEKDVLIAKNGHTMTLQYTQPNFATMTYLVDDSPVAYIPVSISSHGDAVGTAANGSNPTIYYAGGGADPIPGATSVQSINYAVLTTNGVPVDCPQVVGTDADSDWAIFQKDPTTGTVTGQKMSDLVQDSNYTGIIPGEINDAGMIDATATKAGQTHVTLLVPDQITRDGNPINSTNNTVWVGQQINLTNMVLGSAPNAVVTSYQWNVPGATNGTAFKDYQPDAGNSNYTNLAPSDLTNSYCNFYWANGGTNTVTCTQVIYGQTNTISATFNVNRPLAGIAATNGVIAADTNYGTGGSPYLHFGNYTSGATPGITFTETNSPSGSSGTFVWNQLINSDSYTATTASSTNTFASSGYDGASDNEYPYVVGSTANDSPASPLSSTGTSLYRNFTATMYLMWQPNTNVVNGDNTVAVPLKSYQWNWTGTATNSPSGWHLANSSLPPAAQNVDVTNEPTWSTNAALDWHSVP